MDIVKGLDEAGIVMGEISLFFHQYKIYVRRPIKFKIGSSTSMVECDAEVKKYFLLYGISC